MNTDEIQSEKKARLVAEATLDGNDLNVIRPPAVADLSLIGRVLSGQYEVLEELGEGGMSTVYLGRHRGLNEPVAIKVLHVDRSAKAVNLQRFEVEAKATYKLNHPNLIRLLDFSIDQEDRPFLVMEYVKGKTLSDVLMTEGRFDLNRFVSVFTQVCDGLEYAHSKGIIHRDLKPSNILLSTTGNDIDQIKIVDFGIAKLAQNQDQQLTQAGDIFGSPLYMSPEQCRGLPPDQRSDLYSLGCAMFECLTGEPPYRGDNAMRTMFMHSEQPIPGVKLEHFRTPRAAQAIEEIVTRLLSKKPEKRFASALAVKERLQAALQLKGPRETALPASTRISDEGGFNKNGKFSRVIVACVCFIATVLTAMLFHRMNHGEPYKPKPAPLTAPHVATAGPIKQDDHIHYYVPSKQARAALMAQIMHLEAQSLGYEQAGNKTAAERILLQAIQLADKQLDHKDPEIRNMLVHYGVLLYFDTDHPNPDKVIEVFSRAEPLLSIAPALTAADKANVYGWHGLMCLQQGDTTNALRLSRIAESLTNTDPRLRSNHLGWMTCRAKALAAEHQINKALEVYNQAEKLAGDNYADERCTIMTNRAIDLWQVNRKAEALASFEASRKLVDSGKINKLGETYRIFKATEQNLGLAGS